MTFRDLPFSAQMIQAMVSDEATTRHQRRAELRDIQVLRENNEHRNELVKLACDLLEAMIVRADNRRHAPATIQDFACRMARSVANSEKTYPRYRDEMLKIVVACGGRARL